MSKRPNVKKVVLAYSGGLDTSVILRWIKEEYGCEVVGYAADLGQDEDLSGIKDKALATGASDCFVRDVREEFARDFIYPMMRGAAVYESGYLLGTSIARPLIAQEQMKIAAEVGADAVAHGATGKGNDQVRFELAYLTLDPKIKVIAPWREWDLKSRSDCVAYAEKFKIPIEVTAEKPYSMDANLLHISYEGGILEDPWFGPKEDMFRLTRSVADALDAPQTIEIEVEAGNAVALDGKRLSPLEMMQALNRLGGEHGIGRVDIAENRFVGMKSRGVYETPGGTILYHALRGMEQITLDREVLHLRNSLVPKYAELVYNGFWFAPEREALQVFMDHVAQDVTGTVRLRLHKGNVVVEGRKSEHSLYDPELVTFEEDSVYDQADATGFIRLQALRLQTNAARAKKQGK